MSSWSTHTSRSSRPPWLSAEGAWDGLAKDISASLVVPYYKPTPALLRHLSELDRALERSGATFELIAVSDGADRAWVREVLKLDLPRLVSLELEQNMGKGMALRQGFRLARYDWVGFIDSDGDIPASLLPYYLAQAATGRFDVAVASKAHPLSVNGSNLLRRLGSAAYQRVAAAAIPLGVKDTQTGLKLFRRQVLLELLEECEERRFAFDLELMALASARPSISIEELPVWIVSRNTTTLSPRGALRLAADTLRVARRFPRQRRLLSASFGKRPSRAQKILLNSASHPAE
jgi:glycosyltransferase involved in cell wall biosynthesis